MDFDEEDLQAFIGAINAVEKSLGFSMVTAPAFNKARSKARTALDEMQEVTL